MIIKMIIFIIAYIFTAMSVNAQNVQETSDIFATDSLDMHQLQEVVVKGQLPNTRLKGNALVTRITGSPLEKTGTAEDVLGKVDVDIENAINKGLYTEIKSHDAITAKDIKKIEKRMRQLVKADRPFVREKLTK